ncbi:TrmB family transcriptional regulator [Haloferacaceae archaeon DSL9]
MAAATHQQPLDSLPGELDSAQSKLVYLYLQSSESATVDELRAALGMKCIALFPTLETLTEHGLVEQHGERYTAA